MTPRLTGLWRQPAFVLVWTAQTVSQLGSQVTLVALPLAAILVLGASPTQVGLLTAMGFAPAVVLGLFAGVWADRLRRRPLLIACHLTLALLTLSVPVAGWLGRLRLEHLFLLEGVGGALAVLSNAASQAYVPSLVGTDHVVEANAKLATSRAVARIVGPGLAGALVQLISAPTAILVDALSFALSAACLLRIRVPELQPLAAARRGVWAEMHEGLYLLLRHRLLRPLVVALGLYNLFAGLFVAVYTLFMVRALGLDPAAVGAVIAGGGIGGIVGGLGAEPASRRLGIGRSIVGGAALLAVAHLAAPLASGPPAVTVPLLVAAGMLANLGLAVTSVNQTSLIQRLVPAHALGRVAATQQVLVTATVPLGAAAGGLLGEALGLRATVAIAAVGTIAAVLTLVASPLWTLSDETHEDGDDRGHDASSSQPPRPSAAAVWRMAGS